MKTLDLQGGDLVVRAGGHATISGAAKLAHDLSLAVREPYRVDRFHPGWGSILHRYVGETAGDEVDLLVRSEITRIVKNYAMIQARRIDADAAAGRRARMAPEEIVADVGNIVVRQTYDSYRVTVDVLTVAGTTVPIDTEVT